MRSSVKRIRRAAIEALEGRRLMTATIDSFTLDNYEAPIMSGSEVVLPGSLVEGMSQTASLNFHTDHDNLDGGVCHVHFDYGDPNCPPAQNSSDQWVANYAGASHVYNEAGTYVMTATVTDTAGDGTTYTWTAGSDEQAVYVAASEGTLSPVTNGGDFSFEPNSTFALPAGAVEFSDSSAATLDTGEYTGTIDWGDGNQSAASFAIDPSNHAIEVLGFHTYSYVMDPDTGNIAHPVADYGEQLDNPISVHVDEAGGGSVDLSAIATVASAPYIVVTGGTKVKDQPNTVNVSTTNGQVGATGKLTITVTAMGANEKKTAMVGVVQIKPISGTAPSVGESVPKAVVGDTSSFTIDITWTVNRVTAGDYIQYKITGNNSWTPFKIIFT